MFNPDTLNDGELAACVDAYCERIVNNIRSRGFEKKIHIMIFAHSGYPSDEYEIQHCLEVGPYGSETKSKTNNILNAIDTVLPVISHDECNEPRKVRTMLPAPIELRAHDADDMPF